MHSLPLSLGNAQVDWWPPDVGRAAIRLPTLVLFFGSLKFYPRRSMLQLAWLLCLRGKGKEVNSHSHSSRCVFKRRQGTPEPTSHGADQPEFLRQGSRYEHLFMASTSLDPPRWQPSLYVSQWTAGLLECQFLCARISASSWVCLRTYLLSSRMISEVSEQEALMEVILCVYYGSTKQNETSQWDGKPCSFARLFFKNVPRWQPCQISLV